MGETRDHPRVDWPAQSTVVREVIHSVTHSQVSLNSHAGIAHSDGNQSICSCEMQDVVLRRHAFS
jgi:hypothetical protein